MCSEAEPSYGGGRRRKGAFQAYGREAIRQTERGIALLLDKRSKRPPSASRTSSFGTRTSMLSGSMAHTSRQQRDQRIELPRLGVDGHPTGLDDLCIDAAIFRYFR
jgi:hypothetical protein